MESVESALAELSPGDWVWAVQLETSTGVANPAESLARLCSARGLRLSLDAVSAGFAQRRMERALKQGLTNTNIQDLQDALAVAPDGEP